MSLRDIGKIGETIATSYLERNGYFVIRKNWTIPGGEIDIIAEKDGQTIFFEVKYRTSEKLGHARETLSHQKRIHFRRSGLLYASKNNLPEDRIQFDFIAIQSESGHHHLEHYKNIALFI